MKQFQVIKIRKIWLFTVVVILLNVFQGCNNDENLEILSQKEQSTEQALNSALDFKRAVSQKRDFFANLAKSQSVTKSNNSNVSGELLALNKKSLDMLEDYGIYYDDLKDAVDGKDDIRITLIGMLWVATLETNNETISDIKRLKTKSEEDGPCYNLNTVLGCVSNAIFLTELTSILQGINCLSKEIILAAFKVAAKRALGVAGVALAIVSFGDCMGWYDIPEI